MSASNCCLLPETPYHPSKDFVFPKTKFGSRNCSCHHNWFDTMAALWHWERLYILLLLHEERIKTDNREKHRTSTHIVRFEDLKNALECFKDHQNSKRYKGAATLAVIVPSCGDPLAMMNQQPAKSRAEEPKYLKFVMECIQYLSGQRMPIRGSVNVNQGMPIISMIIWHSYWSFEIKANQQFWKRFLLLQPVTNANTHTNSTKTN